MRQKSKGITIRIKGLAIELDDAVEKRDDIEVKSLLRKLKYYTAQLPKILKKEL